MREETSPQALKRVFFQIGLPARVNSGPSRSLRFRKAAILRLAHNPPYEKR